jgi:hypothetical protein
MKNQVPLASPPTVRDPGPLAISKQYGSHLETRARAVEKILREFGRSMLNSTVHVRNNTSQ